MYSIEFARVTFSEGKRKREKENKCLKQFHVLCSLYRLPSFSFDSSCLLMIYFNFNNSYVSCITTVCN